MISLSPRLLISCLSLLLLGIALGLWSLGSGVLPLSASQVIDALLGAAPRNITLVVVEWLSLIHISEPTRPY